MKFEINTDALERDISQLTTQSQSLKSNLEALHTSMTALNATWEGAAKTAYMAQYQADYESMQSLCSVLEEYIKTLTTAKTKYISCDNSVRSAVAQIRV